MKRPGAVQLLGGVQELPHEDARLALGEGPHEQVAEARADQLQWRIQDFNLGYAAQKISYIIR
jgi:hypothetical protein